MKKINLLQIPHKRLKQIFLLFCLLFLILGAKTINPLMIHGDGNEYTLMTEAFYNHFSPNVTKADIQSFKNKYTENHKWENLNQHAALDAISQFVSTQQPKLNADLGFYSSGTKFYPIHFWFYSLLNVPAYFICDIFNLNPLLSFIITNILLLFCTIVLLTFCNPLTDKKLLSFLPALLVLLSPVIWYISWGHCEVFLITLVVSGLWLYFILDKKFIGILLLALVSQQNQTIAVMVFFLCIDTLIREGIKPKVILKLFFTSVWVLLPPIFYYYNFGVFSLISHTHKYSTAYMSVGKFFSLLFDIDQGTIIGYPLLIPSYLLLSVLFFIKKENRTKQNFRIQGLIFGSFLILSIIVTGMYNWNHGMSIINRYSVWISVILFVGIFHLMKGIKPLLYSIVLGLNIVAQSALIVYFGSFNANSYTTTFHNVFSEFAFRNCPDLYNPNYQIFIIRTLKFFPINIKKIPYLAYFDDYQRFSKLIIRNDKLDALDSLCKKGIDIDSLKQKLKNEDKYWVYVNRGDKVIDIKRMYKANREILIKLNEAEILNSDEWMKLIRTKAKQNKRTVKEQLKLDAIYEVEIKKSDHSNGLK